MVSFGNKTKLPQRAYWIIASYVLNLYNKQKTASKLTKYGRR